MRKHIALEVKRRGIPPLHSQDQKNPIVYMVMSLYGLSWRWFVTEAEVTDSDILFYGLVEGHEKEWGYFRLSELQEAKSALFIGWCNPPRLLSKIK